MSESYFWHDKVTDTYWLQKEGKKEQVVRGSGEAPFKTYWAEKPNLRLSLKHLKIMQQFEDKYQAFDKTKQSSKNTSMPTLRKESILYNLDRKRHKIRDKWEMKDIRKSISKPVK